MTTFWNQWKKPTNSTRKESLVKYGETLFLIFFKAYIILLLILVLRNKEKYYPTNFAGSGTCFTLSKKCLKEEIKEGTKE